MFFLQQLDYLVFLQVSSTLFSIFSVPRVSWAYFCFPLRLLLLALFVHVFHFNRSFLFWFVCVPFGSGSQYFVWNEIFLFVYTVRDRSAPGAGSFSKTRYCDCGAGPLGSRAGFVSERIVFCIQSGTIRLREPGFV